MSEAETEVDPVTNAIRIAKQYLKNAYSEENIYNVGLEELQDSEHGPWKVTLGFTRPWDLPKQLFADHVNTVTGGAVQPVRTLRTYKVITVDMDLKKAISMENRDPG